MKENGILILSGILDKHLSKVENKYSDLKQVEVIQKKWMGNISIHKCIEI